MKHLISVKRIDNDSAETVLMQYDLFMESIPALKTKLFSGFSPFQEKGIDKFLAEKFSDNRYAELFTTVKCF